MFQTPLLAPPRVREKERLADASTESVVPRPFSALRSPSSASDVPSSTFSEAAVSEETKRLEAGLRSARRAGLRSGVNPEYIRSEKMLSTSIRDAFAEKGGNDVSVCINARWGGATFVHEFRVVTARQGCPISLDYDGQTLAVRTALEAMVLSGFGDAFVDALDALLDALMRSASVAVNSPDHGPDSLIFVDESVEEIDRAELRASAERLDIGGKRPRAYAASATLCQVFANEVARVRHNMAAVESLEAKIESMEQLVAAKRQRRAAPSGSLMDIVLPPRPNIYDYEVAPMEVLIDAPFDVAAWRAGDSFRH